MFRSAPCSDKNTTRRTPASRAAVTAGNRSRFTFPTAGGRTSNIASTPAKAAGHVEASVKSNSTPPAGTAGLRCPVRTSTPGVAAKTSATTRPMFPDAPVTNTVTDHPVYMYDTHIMDVDEADLRTLDQALISMRRFLQAPRNVPDGGQHVELSTLLVLDAIDHQPSASIRDVAERLQVTHSTASRLVQRAVDAGAISRAAGQNTRRTTLTPTAAGTALSDRARAFRYDQLRQRLHGWTPTQIRTFAHALHRFTSSDH